MTQTDIRPALVPGHGAETAAPFDPGAVAAARGDEPRVRTVAAAVSGSDISPRQYRERLAGLGPLDADALAIRYPVFPDLFDDPDFAGLAEASRALADATRRREAAQDAYEDAEAAYPRAQAVWEAGQRDLALKVAAGGKVPAKIAERPSQATFEAHADLLARIAGEAVRAERRAVATMNAACAASAALVTPHAAKVQRECGEVARQKLAEALAAIAALREAYDDAYAARTVETADALAAAEGRPSASALTRVSREGAAALVAQSFYSRAVYEVEGLIDRDIARLRQYVDAMTLDADLSRPWPDGADPIDAARRIRADREARRAA